MSNRTAPLVLLVAVVGAGVFAVMRADSAPPATTELPSTHRFGELGAPDDLQDERLPPNHPPLGAGALPNGAAALPPNHPPISAGRENADDVHANDEGAALTWKVPDGWRTAPNPGSMRIATYQVPRAPGDSDDAELSVSRAGGTTEANLQRWIGQFDELGTDNKQSVRVVGGVKFTTVEIGGTYQGGMTGAPASAPRRGWALLGAVVETHGSPYFFKMTGPSATVRGARASFDSLLASLTALSP